MGGAVVFVITISSFVTALIYKYILANSYLMSKGIDLTYLQTIVFILVIAALVFVECSKKSMPALLPEPWCIPSADYDKLCRSRCCTDECYQGIRYFGECGKRFCNRIWFPDCDRFNGRCAEDQLNDIKPFQGTAIVLISACLMSIAFMGFSGMI